MQTTPHARAIMQLATADAWIAEAKRLGRELATAEEATHQAAHARGTFAFTSFTESESEPERNRLKAVHEAAEAVEMGARMALMHHLGAYTNKPEDKQAMTRIAALIFLAFPACLPPMEGTFDERDDVCLVTVSQRVDNPLLGGKTCEETRGYCCWYVPGQHGVSCVAPIDTHHRCECPPLHVDMDTEVECAGEVDEGVCYWGMSALECLP